MDWMKNIGSICVLNLLHRTDRLLEFTEMMEKFEIPFERVSAIHDKEQGARGLRDTMVELFTEEIAKGTQHLLVFEDDAEIVVERELFDNSMNEVMKELPESYHICFLGCQITSNGCKRHSPHLIKVVKAFSTHAVIWSLQGMKEVMARGMGFPIDNWMVDHIEPLAQSYCTNPFLVSQRDGVSDIGGNFISWKPFLEQRFRQKIGEIR